MILTPLEKIKEEQIDSCLGSPLMFSAKKKILQSCFLSHLQSFSCFQWRKRKRLVDPINKSSCYMKLEARKIPFLLFEFQILPKKIWFEQLKLMKRRWLRLNEILGRHYSFMQPKSIAAAVVSPIWQICILDIIRYFQISYI